MAGAVARPATRTLSVAQHPIYSMPLPVPVVCFIGALNAVWRVSCPGANAQGATE